MKLIDDVVIWSGRTDLPSGAAYTFVRCARKLEELEAKLDDLKFKMGNVRTDNDKLRKQLAEVHGLHSFSVAYAPIGEKAVWVSDIEAIVGDNDEQ